MTMFTRFPLRYLLPNAITALSIIFACVSILRGHVGNYESAAWLVVWCVLLDQLDGAVARVTNARSEFGSQFDSLTDFLAFCVSPGLLAYFFLTQNQQSNSSYEQPVARAFLLVSVLVYIVSGAIRLARFNVSNAGVRALHFEGLSSTFAGLIVASYLLCVEVYSWHLAAVVVTPLLLLTCAFLMITNLTLPKSLTSEQSSLFLSVAIAHISIYVFGIFRLYPIVIFIIALAYPVVGFTIGIHSNHNLTMPNKSLDSDD